MDDDEIVVEEEYEQLQFDFMKDFENSETCQMKN